MTDIDKNIAALKSLAELKAKGHLTDEEFQLQKEKLLNGKSESKNERTGNFEVLLLTIPLGAALLMRIIDNASAFLILAAVLGTAVVAAIEIKKKKKETLEASTKKEIPGATAWFMFIGLLWVIGYPLYLYKRREYGLPNRLLAGMVVMVVLLGSLCMNNSVAAVNHTATNIPPAAQRAYKVNPYDTAENRDIFNKPTLASYSDELAKASAGVDEELIPACESEASKKAVKNVVEKNSGSSDEIRLLDWDATAEVYLNINHHVRGCAARVTLSTGEKAILFNFRRMKSNPTGYLIQYEEFDGIPDDALLMPNDNQSEDAIKAVAGTWTATDNSRKMIMPGVMGAGTLSETNLNGKWILTVEGKYATWRFDSQDTANGQPQICRVMQSQPKLVLGYCHASNILSPTLKDGGFARLEFNIIPDGLETYIDLTGRNEQSEYTKRLLVKKGGSGDALANSNIEVGELPLGEKVNLCLDISNQDKMQEIGAEILKACQQAADTGNDRAQNALGFYYRGRNSHDAIKWYTMAAEQGLVTAMFNLGSLYAQQLQWEDAYFWFYVAAHKGDKEAGSSLKGIASQYAALASLDSENNARQLLTRVEVEAKSWLAQHSSGDDKEDSFRKEGRVLDGVKIH